MRYMLLMVGGPDYTPPPDIGEPCYMPWVREMATRDDVVLHDGARLRPTATATTVSVRDDGEVLLSDGPFAETKEQILGYHVIECADLDEAVYVASRHPGAERGGRIEIRPVLPG
jgi:hypothetical protein